jgi:hypothetical protein
VERIPKPFSYVGLVAQSGLTGMRDHVRYGYDPLTGALSWVEGLGPDTRFDYRYDRTGRLETAYLPANLVETHTYDLEARAERRRVLAPAGGSFAGGTMLEATFAYDQRHKILQAQSAGVLSGNNWNEYDGMGHLVSAQHSGSPIPLEFWDVDALGNVASGQKLGSLYAPYVHTFEPYTGRLRYMHTVGDTSMVGDTIHWAYDDAGNQIRKHEWSKPVPHPNYQWNEEHPIYAQSAFTIFSERPSCVHPEHGSAVLRTGPHVGDGSRH